MWAGCRPSGHSKSRYTRLPHFRPPLLEVRIFPPRSDCQSHQELVVIPTLRNANESNPLFPAAGPPQIDNPIPTA